MFSVIPQKDLQLIFQQKGTLWFLEVLNVPLAHQCLQFWEDDSVPVVIYGKPPAASSSSKPSFIFFISSQTCLVGPSSAFPVPSCLLFSLLHYIPRCWTVLPCSSGSRTVRLQQHFAGLCNHFRYLWIGGGRVVAELFVELNLLFSECWCM